MKFPFDGRGGQQGMAGESCFVSVKQKAAETPQCISILSSLGFSEQKILAHQANISKLKNQLVDQDRQIALLE